MEAAVLLLAAPALGLSAGASTSDVLTPKADITVLACDKCGLKFGNGKVAAPNCCSVGGSWHGFCDGESHLYRGEQRTHTWHEGFAACSSQEAEELLRSLSDPNADLKPALPPFEALSDTFLNGKASNDVSKVGLLFHGFDQTEDEFAPYKPCATGYCAQFEKFWPASIINAHQRNAYGSVGILFEPTKNRVLCSWPEDDSNRGHGDAGCDSNDGKMFRDDELEKMLNISMAKGDEGSSGYNEALIDSKMFLDNLPGSIAAIVYGINGGDDDGEPAVAAYAGLLSAYNLTEADVPLLKASFSASKGRPLKGPVFTDESSRAGPRLQQIRDGGVTLDSAMSELSRRWRGAGAQQQQQQQPETYTHNPPEAWRGKEHAPSWGHAPSEGSPLAWEGKPQEPPPPGSEEGSPQAWEGSPLAWSAQQQQAGSQAQQGAPDPKWAVPKPGEAPDPYGLMKARKQAEESAPEEMVKEKTVKGDAEVGKFVTGSGPNGVRVAPEMKCVGVDGKPSYCSARGATRESPARRQEATALANP